MFLLREGVKKCVERFDGLDKIPKLLIRYGLIAFLLILMAGTIVLSIHKLYNGMDPNMESIGNHLVKNSFTLLLEIIVGALAMDFVVGSRKNKNN